MKTQFIELYCSTCEHAVKTGVACDWQPEQCPNHYQEQRSRGGAEAWKVLIASADALEYDAVRGQD